MGEADRAGQLRHVDGVAAARHRGDRRAPVADGGRLRLRAVPHLGAGASHRHLLRRPTILRRRLRRDVHRLRRPRRPQLPARPGAPLSGLHALQRPYRRAVLAGLSRRAVEPGARLGPGHAPADPGPDPRPGRDGAADPDHARQPARRAAQALRGDGALQGPVRGARDPEIPRAGGPQPVREHDRLHAALYRIGQHHRVPRAGPSHRRTAAPQGSHRAGYVSRRHDRSPPRRDDGHRHADLGRPARLDRPAHPFKRVYRVDPAEKIPIRFFAEGFEYRFLGLIATTRHLIGVEPGLDAARTIFVLGTDVQGRDLFSRLTYGTRISLTIGLFGVTASLVLGVVLGGLSGFYGGVTDTLIQRVIEILRSIPTIPLWMGLAAALPREWSVLQVYFAITIIISLLGWTELARVVRGRFLALREEDFVVSARLVGCSEMRTIFVHMVPAFMSHIIAATTLALPAMIISETALSFLGLGLRPPAISWGVLLQHAQNVQTVAISPWLMLPAVPVIVAVMAFNFLGDGLRDAADPYGR